MPELSAPSRPRRGRPSRARRRAACPDTDPPARPLASTLARLGAGTAVLLGTALHPTPAFAHNVYNTYTVWDDGTHCTLGGGEISHGNGNGYVKSTITAHYYVDSGSGSRCDQLIERPALMLRVRWEMRKYRGPDVSDMDLCIGPVYGGNQPYLYQDHTDYQVTTDYYVPSGPGDTPPCGYGSYTDYTDGGVRYGDVWQSGQMWPGWHDFPAPK